MTSTDSAELHSDPPTEERTVITRKPGSSDSTNTQLPRELFPVLLVQSGPALGDWFQFPPEQDELFVGRGRECEFRIRDGSVSRKHARFRVVREAARVRVWVEDLGSTNGTRVGVERISGPSEIEDGDTLAVGDIRLRFRVMDRHDAAFQEGLAKQAQDARKDPLTGLLTRRYLDDHLPGLLEAHAHNHQAISVLLLDVDHFKLVNDRHGHLVGDEVLCRIADAVRGAVRGADTAVRYGGEEFCVVLPGTAEDIAERVAERMRRSVEAMDLDEARPGLRVTASVGVATLVPGEPIEHWLGRADRALYCAKDAGRNRVCVAARPASAPPRPAPPRAPPPSASTRSTTAERRRDDPVVGPGEPDPLQYRRRFFR